MTTETPRPNEVPVYPHIDLFGATPESIRLTGNVTGFAGVVDKRQREALAPPGTAAIFTLIPDFGYLAVAYSPCPANYLKSHPPQDAGGFLYDPQHKRLVLVTCDGATTVTDPNRPLLPSASEEFAIEAIRQLAVHQSSHYLTSFAWSIHEKVESKLNTQLVGATTLKATSITALPQTRVLSVETLLIGPKGDLGPTLIQRGEEEIEEFLPEFSSDPIGLKVGYTNSFDLGSTYLTPGSSIALFTDGKQTFPHHKNEGKVIKDTDRVAIALKQLKLNSRTTAAEIANWFANFNPHAPDDCLMVALKAF